MELQNIFERRLLNITAQSAQKGEVDVEETPAAQPQASQTQTSAQNSLFSNTANSNPALLNILNNVLQSSEKIENIDGLNTANPPPPHISTQENSSEASVDKFAARAQTVIDKAAVFAKLTEEVLKQLDNLPLLPKEKEFTEAFVKEIENIIRKTSPSSPIVQIAETLPKTASVENIYRWAATQIKDGNLPVRDLFALPQILLANANTVIEPTTSSAQSSTPAVYTSSPAAMPAANQNIMPAPISVSQKSQTTDGATFIPVAVSQNNKTADVTAYIPPTVSQNNKTENINSSIPANTDFSQNNKTANVSSSISPAAISQNNQTTDFKLPTPIEKPNATQFAETPKTIPSAAVNPPNIQKTDVAVSIPANTDFSQNNKTVNITSSISPAAISQNNQTTDFKLPTPIEKPNAAQFAETPKTTFITAANSNPILEKSVVETPNATPIIDAPKIISANRYLLSPQEPKDILFVQQTTANLKENIQNLIPQIQNESIKNLLNEIVLKILPEKDTAAFAFVKIDGKNDSFVRFLPLALQTQFNSEFSSVLSKSFPEFSKELLTDTANIIRNGEKPIVISANVIKNIENILRHVSSNVSAEPQTQTQTPNAAQWKITAPILSTLLQYAAKPDNNETILQNFKVIFTAGKNIENISSDIKSFVERLENIDKKTVENPSNKPNLISQELSKSVEKLNNMEKILRNAEAVFKKENSIEYLMDKIGILQNKPREQREQQPKIEENLRTVLREISQQIKISSQKLQTLPDLHTDDKLDDAFLKLKTLSNSVNDLSRKIDAANLLANKVDVSAGRSEQTILVPVSIGNAWIQMEFRINKDDKNKNNKNKKQAEQVELNVELDKGNSVSAKANLTLEKQLQVSINFTNDKMLEWFKQHYKEFCEALESIGTKSLRVIFNRENSEEERREKNEIIKSNFDITG